MAAKRTKTTPSSVCRVNKNGNYTVMSNYHLRSPNLSLKAVGLLSRVLALPDDWDYSVAGLVAICKEKETAVKSALDELKYWGYLRVTKLKPNETKSGRIEYVYDFFEYSEKDVPQDDSEKEPCEKQGSEKQGIEILPLEIQGAEIQGTENQGQINTNKKIRKNKIFIDQVSINQSFGGQAVERPIDGSMDGYSEEQRIYTDVVKENIEYEDYAEWIRYFGGDNMTIEELDDIVGMIVRAIVSRKPTERICGEVYPREVIKSVMLKVDKTCIENAIDIMRQTEDIRNYERYLISTLFNEANGRHFKEQAGNRSIDYAVRHDMGGF